MDREIVLSILALTLCGATWVGCGALTGRWGRGRDGVNSSSRSARWLEHLAWRRLWQPLLPGGFLLAFLVGWALQEPSSAEPLHVMAFVVALPFALVWARVSLRAWRSRAVREVPLAGTVGLLRPRVVITEPLRDKLDPAALGAVIEHEAAHLRHRDPLRLWLAQIATDLQWPAAAARRRFAQWRAALELARDEEALSRGVDGGDLAAALVAGARLGGAGRPSREGSALAGLLAEASSESSSEAFRERVMRLLQPLPATERERGAAGNRRWAVGIAVAMLTVAVLGHAVGESIIARFADLGL
jgi:BlaR1 peptidase M56